MRKVAFLLTWTGVVCLGWRGSLADITTFEGSPWDRNLGQCLRLADFNGDGVLDIVASAPYADVPGKPWAGAVYILEGGLQLQEKMAEEKAWKTVFRILGEEPYGSFGLSLACGDLNGDGCDDLVVGAPYSGHAWAGSVHVILGRPGPIVGTWPLSACEGRITVMGAFPNMKLGTLVGCGDMDGDGLDDLAFTSPGYQLRSLAHGCVMVILGKNLLNDTEWRMESDPVDALYYAFREKFDLVESMAFVDTEGRGKETLFLGIPTAAVRGEMGLGKVLGLQYDPMVPAVDVEAEGADWIYVGAPETKGLGSCLLACDLEGDGAHELVVGATRVRSPKGVVGAFYLFATGSTEHWVECIHMGEPYGATGGSAAVGDLNANGKLDLLVGAPGEDLTSRKKDAGIVYWMADLFSSLQEEGGGDRSGAPAEILVGVQGYGNLGQTLVVGDVSGDGREDLVTGAPGFAHTGDRDGGHLVLLLTH